MSRARVAGIPRLRHRRPSSGFLCFLLACAVLAGCGVLTRSQVSEIAAFAKVTANYGTLPGEPIRVYAQVNSTDRLINVAARNFNDPDARTEGIAEIKKAHGISSEFTSIADQADAALSVLDTYAELLSLLASDDFTEALEKSASELGKSLDGVIGKYNEQFRKQRNQPNLKHVGATVAGVIRGIGGIYLRYRQQRLLKDYVTEADDVIGVLTQDVEYLMSGEPTPDGSRQGVKQHLSRLRERLEDDLTTLAARAGILPLSTVVAVSESFAHLETAEKLCDLATASAKSYRVAHAKLKVALTHRQDLKARLEEIEVLRQEIQAARKLKKSLEK